MCSISPQAGRPVWLQCAMDDYHAVPWRSVVEPSLRKATRRSLGDHFGVRFAAQKGP